MRKINDKVSCASFFRSGSLSRCVAFSLIELLIVITIIGILVVAFLPSITSGPSRARDVTRVADLADVALALELYFQDNGEYPGYTTSDYAGDLSGVSGLGSYFDSGEVPMDPIGGRSTFTGTSDGEYWYATCDSGQGYLVVAWPENAKSTDGYYDIGASAPTVNACSDLSSTGVVPDGTGDPNSTKYAVYKN